MYAYIENGLAHDSEASAKQSGNNTDNTEITPESLRLNAEYSVRFDDAISVFTVYVQVSAYPQDEALFGFAQNHDATRDSTFNSVFLASFSAPGRFPRFPTKEAALQ